MQCWSGSEAWHRSHIVDDAARQRRLDEFARIVRARGMRCTVQRRAILEAVLELDNHPSAEQVLGCARVA
jgi:Fe2+ or Zn2+ uptake regulation protein